MNLFEMTCTGNSGRSPPAEVKGNIYLAQIREDKLYHCISSGTGVDAIVAGNIPYQVQEAIVQKAIAHHHIFTPTELDDIKKAMQAKDVGMLISFYNKVRDVFVAQEHEYRAAAMEAFGLDDQVRRLGIDGIKTQPEQTIVRPDVVAIWPMAPSNTKAVNGVYTAAGYAETPSKDRTFATLAKDSHQVVVGTLPAYARADADAQLTDSFGGTRKQYFETFAQVIEAVPEAIDRFLNNVQMHV